MSRWTWLLACCLVWSVPTAAFAKDEDDDGWDEDDDCDDEDEDVNPGEHEDCDTSVDDNCDGDVNEGCDTGHTGDTGGGTPGTTTPGTTDPGTTTTDPGTTTTTPPGTTTTPPGTTTPGPDTTDPTPGGALEDRSSGPREIVVAHGAGCGCTTGRVGGVVPLVALGLALRRRRR